jgi:hypothetical protein
MKRIASLSLALLAASAAEAQRRDDLVAIARAAPMAAIESERERCGDPRTFGAWFDELVAPRATRVRWSAGACRTAVPNVPRDSGGAGARCARAEILPRGRRRTVLMEVYLERSGGDWRAYAFRAVGDAREGWEDYLRFPTEFEAIWRTQQGLEALPEPDDEGCRYGETPAAANEPAAAPEQPPASGPPPAR